MPRNNAFFRITVAAAAAAALGGCFSVIQDFKCMRSREITSNVDNNKHLNLHIYATRLKLSLENNSFKMLKHNFKTSSSKEEYHTLITF